MEAEQSGQFGDQQANDKNSKHTPKMYIMQSVYLLSFMKMIMNQLSIPPFHGGLQGVLIKDKAR